MYFTRFLIKRAHDLLDMFFEKSIIMFEKINEHVFVLHVYVAKWFGSFHKTHISYVFSEMNTVNHNQLSLSKAEFESSLWIATYFWVFNEIQSNFQTMFFEQ